MGGRPRGRDATHPDAFLGDFPWALAVRRLLRWYRACGRDLPWRRTRDPYAVWVSEVMLQQTRVESVIPYYLRFMDRFPDVNSLAVAPIQEVLKLWEGLGYYRRAGFLREGARWIAARGSWPDTPEELRKIPGVGRYTAGALASIAFGERSPVLDGNVRRVWARIFAMDKVRGAKAEKELWRLSTLAVGHGPPAEVNQALMELGATICTPRSPDCPRCPIRAMCRSFVDGRAAERPAPPLKCRVPIQEVAVGLLWHRGRFFVQRRPEGGLLGGLWELPGGKLQAGETPVAALHREFLEEVGVRIDGVLPLPVVRHAYSHFKVVLHPFHAEVAGGQRAPLPDDSHRWITPQETSSLPFPAATLKIFATAFTRSTEMTRAAETPAAYVPE